MPAACIISMQGAPNLCSESCAVQQKSWNGRVQLRLAGCKAACAASAGDPMFIRTTLFAAVALLAMPVAAQDATAPDGSEAFGIDPYIGVIGGYHSFDRDVRPGDPAGSRMEGWLV